MKEKKIIFSPSIRKNFFILSHWVQFSKLPSFPFRLLNWADCWASPELIHVVILYPAPFDAWQFCLSFYFWLVFFLSDLIIPLLKKISTSNPYFLPLSAHEMISSCKRFFFLLSVFYYLLNTVTSLYFFFSSNTSLSSQNIFKW